MKASKLICCAITLFALTCANAQVQNPAAQTQPAASQLALDKHWDSPIQGASVIMKELANYLSLFYKPAASISGDTNLTVYEGVTYLMPLKTALEKLGLPQKTGPKSKVTCPGFPKDSFSSYTFTGTFEGDYDQMMIVTDLADQVVSIQFVATKPKKRATTHHGESPWRTYNFVSNKSKALSTIRVYCDVYYHPVGKSLNWGLYDVRLGGGNRPVSDRIRLDSELITTSQSNKSDYNKPLETVRWYVPQPLAELILYCVRKSGV